MYRISLPALVIAFFAEFVADHLIQLCLLFALGGDAVSADMSQDELQKVIEAVTAMPVFTAALVIFGTATTFGGGYLAARIARQYPYYHGLGMGLIGIAFVVYFWPENPGWLSVLSLLSNIPVAIWGAHYAKRHMPPPE